MENDYDTEVHYAKTGLVLKATLQLESLQVFNSEWVTGKMLLFDQIVS